MTDQHAPTFMQVSGPQAMPPELRRELIACWVEVSNAGGAAGFPFPPVTVDEVAPVADQLIAGAPGDDRDEILMALKL
ncbi:hypothetical protein [Planotetraspora sp. GP83]|uniref:hypothetical protein n=1 Tax=Planotetraspora sp. GP83 TaxID=3156264 RepID=UPI0035128260